MVENCGTCKHWLRPEDRTDFSSAVVDRLGSTPDRTASDWDKAEALAAESDRKYGMCEGIDSGAHEIKTLDEPDLPLALSLDGSDYFSAVMTRAEFGCVLWEGEDAD